MLSQYSWGDLIKVVLVALIIYYAYVLIKYYREDIREWIANRGTKPDKQSSTDESEEADHSELYAVSHYAPAGGVQPASAAAPAVTKKQQPTSDLKGIALNEEEASVFSIPILADVKRPAEQSVTELISAAQRLQPNDKGVLVADDPADVMAANLAAVINQQQNQSAFAGISFNR